VGVILVLLTGDNSNLILVFQVVAAFLLLYTVKGFVYRFFVFFLSIFIEFLKIN
jgi:hypothetical protein